MSGKWILGLVALEAIALWALGWVGSATPFPAVPLFTIAFLAYATAISTARDLTRRQIWTAGIVLRLGMIPLLPVLSEDLYRYMWDGWVQRSGQNPFVFPPGAPQLESLRTDWWSMINHPEVSTIYPPGAQFIFLALAWLGPTWWLFKLAWLAADLLVAWLLDRWAGATGQGAAPLMVYLWSPLLVVEVAWSGHLDPIGIAAMVGALVVAGAAQPSRAGTSQPAVHGAAQRALAGAAQPLRVGLLLGVGASIKFAPLAALPLLWRRHGWAAAALAVGVPVLLYLPFASAGSALFSGLRTYADIWQFNAGVYRILERLPGPGDLPKWIGAAAVLSVVVRSFVGRWTLGRALFWTIGAVLIVSPTLHPWYLLWVLPFACRYRSRGWLLYTGTIFLAYAGRGSYLASGVWPEPAWLSALIHGPPLVLLAWDGWRGRASQRLARGDEIPQREQRGERQSGQQS